MTSIIERNYQSIVAHHLLVVGVKFMLTQQANAKRGSSDTYDKGFVPSIMSVRQNSIPLQKIGQDNRPRKIGKKLH